MDSSLPDLTLYFNILLIIVLLCQNILALLIHYYDCLVFAIVCHPTRCHVADVCIYLAFILVFTQHVTYIYSNQPALEHLLLLLESPINSNLCLSDCLEHSYCLLQCLLIDTALA